MIVQSNYQCFARQWVDQRIWISNPSLTSDQFVKWSNLFPHWHRIVTRHETSHRRIKLKKKVFEFFRKTEKDVLISRQTARAKEAEVSLTNLDGTRKDLFLFERPELKIQGRVWGVFPKICVRGVRHFVKIRGNSSFIKYIDYFFENSKNFGEGGPWFCKNSWGTPVLLCLLTTFLKIFLRELIPPSTPLCSSNCPTQPQHFGVGVCFAAKSHSDQKKLIFFYQKHLHCHQIFSGLKCFLFWILKQKQNLLFLFWKFSIVLFGKFNFFYSSLNFFSSKIILISSCLRYSCLLLLNIIFRGFFIKNNRLSRKQKR